MPIRRKSLPLHRVFHSIRFKVNKGWVRALTLFLCPRVKKKQNVILSECQAQGARIAYFSPSAGAMENNAIFCGYGMRKMSVRSLVPQHPAQTRRRIGARRGFTRQHKQETTSIPSSLSGLPHSSIWKKNSSQSLVELFFLTIFRRLAAHLPRLCGKK